MQRIELPLLADLSFPDFGVLVFEYDSHHKHARVQVEGAWLNVGGGRELPPGELRIYNSTRVIVQVFDPTSARWSECGTDEKLRDLCETVFGPGMSVLRGFSSKSGYWTEWRFDGGTAEFSYCE